MVLWIGVDDTDSLRGMCTTFLATEFVRELTRDLDLIGYPRLVRLNPNIPWKTRGNGALAMRFGRGVGQPQRVGSINGQDILSYPRSRGREDPAALAPRVAELVERWSAFDDPTTNPAFVILERRPPASLYWKAVRDIVTRAEARRLLQGLGYVRAYKNGRGIIGAGASVGWRPRDRTYEILAYRKRSSWGTQRTIDPESVRRMDQAFPSTFNNYDYLNDKVVIAPHSPCPVLLGIRGEDPTELPAALHMVKGEFPDRWLVFETNQGTDDHIRWNDWSLKPSTATAVQGQVTKLPQTRSGGHVLFEVSGRQRLTVAVYEPSKQFRDVARLLRPGDRVRLWGSVRDEPRTLNLEKLQVLEVATVVRKVSNPRCPRCHKAMKSRGRDEGYRCMRCHARATAESAVLRFEPRRVRAGLYEPPVSARRHLSKPVKRMAATVAPSGVGRTRAGRPLPAGDSPSARSSIPQEKPLRIAG